MRIRAGAFRPLSTKRRGVLTIIGGTAIGQLFALAASPLLSRAYSPADFGIFTIISASVMLLGTSAALRLELAVPLPTDERVAYSLVAVSLGVSAAIAMLGTAIVATNGHRIADAFGQPDLMPWLWSVPIISSILGAYLVLNQFAVRQQRYRSIGRRNLLQSILTTSGQVTLGLIGIRPGGLLIGLGFGQTLGMLSLLGGAGLRSDAARAGRTATSMVEAIRRYRRFPLLLAPSGLINTAGVQLPVLMIAYSYGSQVAGWLGLTQRVLALPIALIGTAIGQVYLAEASRAKRGDRRGIDELFAAATKRLGIASFALVIPLIALGPWAFPFVFGSAWAESGHYAQALAIGLATQLVAAPTSQTLVIFERHLVQLAWDCGRLFLTVAAIYVCRLMGGSATDAIWVFSITSAITYGTCWVLSALVIRADLALQAKSTDLR